MRDYPADQLLQAAEADVIDYLFDIALVEEVVLHLDQAYQLEPSEHALGTPSPYELPRASGSGQLITRLTLVVPFTGDQELFLRQASTYGSSAPLAELHPNEIHFCWDSNYGGNTPGQIKAAFDGQIQSVQNLLVNTNNDIRQHNERMKTEIPGAVRQRRAKLLADRQTQAAIGYPVRRRSDAATYSVPVTRRRVRTAQPADRPGPTGQAFTPEPIFSDADYEEALRVLISSRNMLERNPSTVAKLGEEEIRNLLLIGLNNQFEGQVGGELFNGAGKTDILVRVNDRNIFIGECKFWDGPKTVSDALSQLLTYLVWRDTKAALLIFVRSGDVEAITEKAAAAIMEHPNFKRRGARNDEDRQDFIVHANSDPAREIKLALLIFPLMTEAT